MRKRLITAALFAGIFTVGLYGMVIADSNVEVGGTGPCICNPVTNAGTGSSGDCAGHAPTIAGVGCWGGTDDPTGGSVVVDGVGVSDNNPNNNCACND